MALFKDRLRELREKNNISREDLAKSLKLSYWAIAKYESGERIPDSTILQCIADYFKVSVDYLLGRSDNPNLIDKKTQKNNENEAKALLEHTHPGIVDLLKRVPDLTQEEQESLAEHWEWAMGVIEEERERRRKFKEKFGGDNPDGK